MTSRLKLSIVWFEIKIVSSLLGFCFLLCTAVIADDIEIYLPDEHLLKQYQNEQLLMVDLTSDRNLSMVQLGLRDYLLSAGDDDVVGLMIYRHQGGTLLTPPIRLGASIDNSAARRIRASISNAEDDGYLLIDGNTEDTVVFSAVRNETDQSFYLRFKGINLPKGVTITSADLMLTPENEVFAPGNISAMLETRSSIDEANLEIPSEDEVSGVVSGEYAVLDWHPERPQSMDVSELIMQAVNQVDWCYGDDIVIKLDGLERREIQQVSAANKLGTSLQIEYEPVSDIGGCKREKRIYPVRYHRADYVESISNHSVAQPMLDSTRLLGSNGVEARTIVKFSMDPTLFESSSRPEFDDVRLSFVSTHQQTEAALIDVRVLLPTSVSQPQSRQQGVEKLKWQVLESWEQGQRIESMNLAELFNQVVRSERKPLEHVVLELLVTEGERTVFSVEQGGAYQPTLSLEWRETSVEPIRLSHRNYLLALVDQLPQLMHDAQLINDFNLIVPSSSDKTLSCDSRHVVLIGNHFQAVDLAPTSYVNQDQNSADCRSLTECLTNSHDLLANSSSSSLGTVYLHHYFLGSGDPLSMDLGEFSADRRFRIGCGSFLTTKNSVKIAV